MTEAEYFRWLIQIELSIIVCYGLRDTQLLDLSHASQRQTATRELDNAT